jgi:hypothetical protein
MADRHFITAMKTVEFTVIGAAVIWRILVDTVVMANNACE